MNFMNRFIPTLWRKCNFPNFSTASISSELLSRSQTGLLCLPGGSGVLFSTAPLPVSLCSHPDLWRLMWFSSGLVLDQGLTLEKDLAHPQQGRIWFHSHHHARGRPPQCWRWTGASGPGSNGKPLGPGSSAPPADLARTVCACVGTR